MEGPADCIARRDAVIAALIAGVFGAGMALFASGFLLLVWKEVGNPADWVAAIGTWVIGYGAWRIARDGHDHRIRESNQREARERDARNAALWQMVVKAVDAKVFADRAQAFVARPPQEQTLKSLLALIEVAISVFERKSWSDAERALLSQDGITALSSLEFELMAQITALRWMQDQFGGNEKRYDDERDEVFAMLVDLGNTLTVDADEFIDHVQSLMTPWGEG
ncbi:TPA: hypothetical protein ACGY79_003026 [Stenotrophomonas maltophilia]